MKRLSSNQTGFTIIELLIAMAFFSFLLMFVTFGFVQINRSYSKGITVKTIQETGRNLLDEITRTIRSTNDMTFISIEDGGYRLCLSGVRYAWNQHIEGSDTAENQTYNPTLEPYLDNAVPFVMVKSIDGQSCDAGVSSDQAEELLDKRAAVQHLSLVPAGGSAYKILLVVSTKSAVEEDLSVFGKEAVCRVQAVHQYCDVALFETVVQIRD